MIDFCYIGNLAMMCYLFMYPTSPHLFALTFANNCGPLLFAIIFWYVWLIKSYNCFELGEIHWYFTTGTS